MKVAVILGGTSFERDVSLKTGKAVVEACRTNNYDVETVVIDKNHKKFIILEDDIMFHKQFHDYFKKIVTTKDYDFLLLGASHYDKNKDLNTQNNLVYTTTQGNGNLLGIFAAMYSNTMANKMYKLRKQNIVYFDYNFYDLFKLNILC